MHIKILEEIGFTKGEIKVYFALLELGPSTTGHIIKKAKVSRSKVYEMLEKLKEKGLVSSVIKENTNYYEAANPKNIIEYLEKKKKEIIIQENDLKKIIPEMILKQKLKKQRQTATVYEGFKGIKTMYNEVLESLKAGEEYYAFAVGEGFYSKEFNRFIINYHRKREEKGIKVKLLANKNIRGIVKASLGRMREIKIRFTEQVTPKATLIFKNKVAMFVWSENPVGVIISSSIIAQQHKELFEQIWKTATP